MSVLKGCAITRGLFLQAFGIQIDDQRNEAMTDGQAGNIEAVSSAMKILVIPTDEEFSIAEQTLEVVSQL